MIEITYWDRVSAEPVPSGNASSGTSAEQNAWHGRVSDPAADTENHGSGFRVYHVLLGHTSVERRVNTNV